MATPIVATKLYRPQPRPAVLRRPRLLAQLRAGLAGPLTLLSAPAGFGKTTLLADGLAASSQQVAWLWLEEADGALPRFLLYLVAALQTVMPGCGASLLSLLSAPQPPPLEVLLTGLVNELVQGLEEREEELVLVLDDYHRAASPEVEQALTFLLGHLPPRLHLVLATREDPGLPLARMRARGQLVELRQGALRFTEAETSAFLTQQLGLFLSGEQVAMLAARTEGWIAGLQLAGLSLQHQADAGEFLQGLGGSRTFVLDYLGEEVLGQQVEGVQQFLLGTAVLERLCGPLCEAVLGWPVGTGQEMLEELERANLFVVPLDGERMWYRYHQLFAELLRQRLRRRLADGERVGGEAGGAETEEELHRRASVWYEGQGLELEAFGQAVAAHDVDRAARLLEGRGMPLHFRGAIAPVLGWLESLPRAMLDARPSLWVMYASALSMTNNLSGVEEKLQAAEAALQGAELNETTRNLIGHIAAIHALLAATQYQADAVIAQSRRALEYLRPDNLPVRTATIWKLGWAYFMQGDRAAAGQALTEAVSLSKASGNTIIYLSALVGLGVVQETELQLALAAQTYQQALQQSGDLPQTGASEAHLGLARISYEWNDLEAAERHGQTSLQLARQVDSTDRYLACEVFLARLELARRDAAGAAARLARAAQAARQQHFTARLPEIAAAQIETCLRQGQLAAAAQLAGTHDLPLSQTQVLLVAEDAAEALTVLLPWREEVEQRGWPDARLKGLLLEGVARAAAGEQEQAVVAVTAAVTLAEPAGCIRSFVDAGPPIAELLAEVAARGVLPEYVGQLLVACAAEREEQEAAGATPPAPTSVLVEPLSRREEEVLRLIAQGLSNQEIAQRLVVALDTVKGHNQKIFSKLQVQRRTEAVARARELGLL